VAVAFIQKIAPISMVKAPTEPMIGHALGSTR
jgi:hypothetical protein